jgi:hypothetical protein
MAHYRRFRRRLPARPPTARLTLPVNSMPLRSTLRHKRLIALVAAVAMVVVICGYASHDTGDGPSRSCHCDWTMHFTGVAGSAPHPAALVKPVLAAWVRPAITAAAPRSVRRLRAHLPRGPPSNLSIG